ncbi:MAG TPA: hypothetical protein VN976_03025 [Verrucomicrobiae bacterium]|nr:hypothetical protein [Verrucomicrobiae bacterium]
MKLKPKMLAAKKMLRRRFHGGVNPGPECAVILDLLRYTMKENPIPAFMELPGFQSLQNTKIKRPPLDEFQGYGRAHWFKRYGSEMKFCVELEPREPYLAPYSVSLFADDNTGLLPEEVLALRELMPGAKLTLAEVAIDFVLAGKVNRAFVRRHGVFGKSRRDISNRNPQVDRWGTKKSGKCIKSYEKFGNAAYRVEARMRRRFMEPAGIVDVYDFPKFGDLLPGHHILFAQIDESKLIRELWRTRTATETVQIVKQVFALKGGLTEQLAYLRQHAGLKNTRRLLRPHRINRSIWDAFNAWGAQWPTKPVRLGKK